MKLQIDPRAGSNKLIDKFEEDEVEVATLPAGDVAFFGNGPNDDVWYIGIEYKKVDDVAQCIKSGRFTGTQLPGMLELYDICFLLVEGILRPNPHTGQLMRYMGKNNSFSMGLTYREFDNFLTSVSLFSSLSGKPCIVKQSGNMLETVNIIKDLYHYFQKAWKDHTSMKTPDRTKMQNVTYDFSLIQEPEPGDPKYPEHILRKSLYQIDRLGWEMAGKIAAAFGTMENLMQASQKDFSVLDGMGPVLANRIYTTLHGHTDPTVIIKKRKAKS